MFTYLGLNLAFTTAILAICWRERQTLFSRPGLLALSLLFGLTLVFDNAIIAAGIVAYNETKLTGLILGLAPIEDFFYPLVGMILLPYVWKKLHHS